MDQRRETFAVVAIAVLGAVHMGLLLGNLWLPSDLPYLGGQLYDVYMQALFSGRFDLPLRDLRFEGHYAPDGTGYLYHGFGPLLTRLVFAPFVEFPTRWIAPLSIWIWSVSGTFALYQTFAFALRRAVEAGLRVPAGARVTLAALAWFGGPGVLLAANGSLFHEPVAMAFALGSGFVLVLVRRGAGATSEGRALVLLAILAGLALHARPHIAVGLYLTVVLLAGWTLGRQGRRVLAPVLGAMAVLGLFGAILIGGNALRHGDPARIHGSFGKSDLQYGFVYWGGEAEDSVRARGFAKYGQFNARRLLPNTAIYLITPPPVGVGIAMTNALERGYYAWGPSVDHVRIERPSIGLVFLWPVWMLLMVAGLREVRLWRMPNLAGMAGVGVGGVLMLSYATITLRYHVDLWPLIALPAAFGVKPVLGWLQLPNPRAGSLRRILWGLAALGVAVSLLAVVQVRYELRDRTDRWSYERCLAVTASKGFAPTRQKELCALPYAE